MQPGTIDIWFWGILRVIAKYLGALTITYFLTRWQIRYFGKKHTPKAAAVSAFIWISLLSLTISSCMLGYVHNSLAQGFLISFFTYMPCLVLWLVRDIIRARK